MDESKAFYLDFHGYVPGTPEAEEAWARKVEMTVNPQRAPMGFVQGDVCYDSPIDGRAITNRHARVEDLKRSGCVEYDPGMRQDSERKAKERDVQLDRAVDATVERAVSEMPSRKRERLQSELQSGVTAEVVRQ